MDRFIARQPIFDLERNVVAAELLFRNGVSNCFSGGDGNEATRQVLFNTFILFGITRLTGGRPAFINFPREVLLSDLVRLLAPNAAVIELLEDVRPDEEVLATCRELRELGYALALDDVTELESWGALVDLASIIKVDFRSCSLEQRIRIASRVRQSSAQLLAEKVETPEEFSQAREEGFVLFQGYFFAKPEVLRQRDIPPNRVQHLRLIRELGKRDLLLGRLEKIIKEDISLSYRLLRAINSPVYGLRSEIKSIRHALTLLGERDIRRWAILAALAGTSSSKPTELLQTALQRARFCESLASSLGLNDPDTAEELFLMGLFSVIDALLDMPMREALQEVGMPPRSRAALLGEASPFQLTFELTLAYEQGNWGWFSEHAGKLPIAPTVLFEIFADAVDWAHHVTGSQVVPVWSSLPPRQP